MPTWLGKFDRKIRLISSSTLKLDSWKAIGGGSWLINIFKASKGVMWEMGGRDCGTAGSNWGVKCAEGGELCPGKRGTEAGVGTGAETIGAAAAAADFRAASGLYFTKPSRFGRGYLLLFTVDWLIAVLSDLR